MNQIRHLLVCFVALFIVNHCNAECGGTFTGVAGTILSDEYVSNMHCLYRITPPSSEYTYVQIAFSSLSTESGYDFVTVFNGPSNQSEVLSKFSGWTIPPTFYSNQPYMTVQFDTDAYVNMNGWILSYQYFTSPAPACAGPRYYPDSMTYGTISFEYVGTSTQEVTCEVVVDAKSYIIYDDYNCQNNVQFSLYSWMDSTLSASFDIYDGPGMYSPWAGSFSSASQIFDSIIVPQRDTFIYLTYSVSSTPSSYSSIDVYFSLTTTCDDEDSHHNSIFILWFTPVIAVSVCLICVVVSIAYRSSKARKNKQTSQYQNLAVPLQAVPQVPHSSNTAPPVFHPMVSPYSGTPASNPYGLPQNEAVIYPQYHPVYAPMNQPMPGLYPNAIPHSLPAVGVPLNQ